MANLEYGSLPRDYVEVDDLAADTYYYPIESGGEEYQKMGDFNNIEFTFTVSGGVTVTFEGCTDEPETAGSWFDITPAGYDITTGMDGYASFVDTSGVIDFDAFRQRFIRVKVVTSDGTNAIVLKAVLNKDEK